MALPPSSPGLVSQVHDRVRILIVEDNEDHKREFERACTSAAKNPRIEFAVHADQAMILLESQDFDLAICDLSIPVDADSLARQPENGARVVEAILERTGTPVIVCSDYATEKMYRRFWKAQDGDPFGENTDRSLLELIPKLNLEECLDEISSAVGQLEDLANLPVTSSTNVGLSESEFRALQIVARRSGASGVEVQEVEGGSSEARVLRVDLIADGGAPFGRLIARVRSPSSVKRERRRFSTFSRSAPPQLCTPLTDSIVVGAGRLGATTYRYADGFDEDLFSVLESDPASGATAARSLQDLPGMDPSKAASIQSTVAEIRRDVVGGNDLTAVGEHESAIRSLDNIRITTRKMTQHGDLHCGNVLVDGDGSPMVIDYADARRTFSTLDPITLELSTIFHPDGKACREDWPSLEQLTQWWELDNFVIGCPFEDYVRACRAWTQNAAGSQEDIDAMVLAYGIRQAGMSKPSPMAIPLIEAAIDRLRP